MEDSSGTASGRASEPGGRAGQPRARRSSEATAPHASATPQGGDDAHPTLRDAEPGTREPYVGGLRRGDAIGRFVMLGLLGAGGMGEVFLCYDPELDRRVAVKLLRPQRGAGADEGPARLLREARAIARLSHPNVVTVHDVAVWEGRVFLAMEYVAGPTLRAWQRARVGDVAAIVEMYRRAGEGLAAAHRAGLVHRDFKPDNVLVDEHGRPRVLDFGIARPVEPEAAEPGPPPWAVQEVTADLQVTTSGALLGTPAYMAPEQLAGVGVEARSDQFSFCVALWEALHGERPFAGDSVAALTESVMRGALREPPREPRVPERVHRALRRGLAVAPQHRFPDMPALLLALAPGKLTTRRARLAAAVAGLALAGAGAAWLGAAEDPARACTGDASRLAHAWGPAQQTSGAAAFAATGAPDAADAWARVVRSVDAWQARWLAARARACDETHRDNRQSAAALGVRLACLEGQVEQLRARAELWADADAQVVRSAALSASALPRPEACDDAALRGRGEPRRADEAEAAAAVRAALARVRAQNEAGRYESAALVAEAQRLAAAELGDPGLRAEVALELGRALELTGQPQAARTAWHEAVRLALEAGREDVALAAATGLLTVVGVTLSHYDEGESWLQVAAGLAARAPGSDGDMQLERASCHYLGDRGRLEQALPRCERALELAEALHGPDSLEVATALRGLGNVKLLGKRHGPARALLDRAWTIERTLLGDRHPRTIGLLNSRAAALFYAGDLRAAMTLWEQALATADASVGGDHVQTGLMHINLALAALDLRDWDRAEREVLALERIYVRVKGQVSSELVFIHHVRGRVALARGDVPAARAHLEQQLRFARETRSPDHPDTLRALLELGDVLARAGEPAAAEQRHTEALVLAEQLGDREAIASALRGQCRARVLLGQPAAAVPAGERALGAAEALERGELLRAETRAWLARALIESQTDPLRGAALAAEARAELALLGEPGQDALAQLAAPAPDLPARDPPPRASPAPSASP